MTLLKNILAGIGAIVVMFWLYQFIWPIIDGQGTIVEGSFRGLQIGDSKSDVADVLMSSHVRSKLKIVGYLDQDGKYVDMIYGGSETQLIDSDTWELSYPNIHQETVELIFASDRLTSIRYFRNMFEP